MPALLDRFLPQPDIRSRYVVTIHAPADVVLAVAKSFDINSILLVRAIFRLRAKLLRAKAYETRHKGLVEGMLELGWERLAEQPGRWFVAGAACQPWQPDVVFTAMDAKPNHVQIAWTLEAEPVGPAETLFATETRAAATDEQSRAQFRRYWRTFRIGILLIRRLLLPAVRREAERRSRIAPAPASG